MKTKLLIILTFVITLNAVARDYNVGQKRFLKSMEEYLTNERGVYVEEQADGLKFKEGEKTYYIELDDEAVSPMFVCLRRYIKYSDLLTKDYVMDKINDFNKKYCVKAIPMDKYLVFSAEMYFCENEQFLSVFPDLFNQLKHAVETAE